MAMLEAKESSIKLLEAIDSPRSFRSRFSAPREYEPLQALLFCLKDRRSDPQGPSGPIRKRSAPNA
jgi:hypothetical protein